MYMFVFYVKLTSWRNMVDCWLKSSDCQILTLWCKAGLAKVGSVVFQAKRIQEINEKNKLYINFCVCSCSVIMWICLAEGHFVQGVSQLKVSRCVYRFWGFLLLVRKSSIQPFVAAEEAARNLMNCHSVTELHYGWCRCLVLKRKNKLSRIKIKKSLRFCCTEFDDCSPSITHQTVLKDCIAKLADCFSKLGAHIINNAIWSQSNILEAIHQITCSFLSSHKGLYTTFSHMW